MSDRYELLEVVGRGGMATVWRARDEAAEMEVAVKVLHEHLVGDEGLVEAFEREAALMRQIDHEGVVRVFETAEVDGRPAFAMELCEGGDLADRLADRGELSEESALEVIIPVLGALQAVHDQGIVHRDLKPHNVMFDLEGTPKLIDFGIGQAEELMAADDTGQLGTVEYMAPERVDGLAVDGRADIYSAGVMLFEMLVGHPPYRADSASEVIRMHRSGDVADPRVFVDDISDSTAEAVIRAMAKHPEQRFDRVEEMVAAVGDETLEVVDVELHPDWEVGRQARADDFEMRAPVETEGHEWVVYVPPEALDIGDDVEIDELLSVFRDYREFADLDAAEIAGGDDDDQPGDPVRHLVTEFGIARGLSRQGVDEVVERLEEIGLVARYGRRPRSMRREPGWVRALFRTDVSKNIWWLAVATVFFAVWGTFEMGRTGMPEVIRAGLFVSLAVVFGVGLGRVSLPATFGEWWKARISKNYLLDFCKPRPKPQLDYELEDRCYELSDEIQSPRITASYERAINAVLHLTDIRRETGLESEAEIERNTVKLLGDLEDLAERIVDVESTVVAVQPVRLTGRIHQIERLLADEDDIEEVERMMDEKSDLRRRLKDRDEAMQQLQALAQRMHEVGSRLEKLVVEYRRGGSLDLEGLPEI